MGPLLEDDEGGGRRGEVTALGVVAGEALSVIASRLNCFCSPSRSPASVQKARYRSAILA